jgi:tetratricopeptide (TPR) repeat protein
MMKPVKTVWILVLLLGLIPYSPALFAQSAGAVPIFQADPQAAVYAARLRTGNYTWLDLTEIALWASSVGDVPAGGQSSFAELMFRAAVELGAAPDLPRDPRERGAYVLTFMYSRYLKTYVEWQTRLDEIFVSGRYNCVSSAVFYMLLADSVGLEVRGVMTKDHAFVTVNTGTELVDVETTNPLGFDPGSRLEFHDGFGQVTGFAYVPARNYRDRVSISQPELISLILSNRISELETRSRFAEVVPLAMDRAVLLEGRLDPVNSTFFADPEKDLMDRLFNYGASLIKAERETDALTWAATRVQYPADSRWQEFIYAALNNLLVKHLRSQRLTEARAALTLYAPELDLDNRSRLEALVLDAELVQESSRISTFAETEDFIGRIEIARTGSFLTASRAEELRGFVILKEGERRAAASGTNAAISYIQESIARYGSSARLQDALRVYQNNRVAELHNNFAMAYNRGEYEEARRLIQGALGEFPGNRQLTTDQTRLEQTLQNRR